MMVNIRAESADTDSETDIHNMQEFLGAMEELHGSIESGEISEEDLESALDLGEENNGQVHPSFFSQAETILYKSH